MRMRQYTVLKCPTQAFFANCLRSRDLYVTPFSHTSRDSNSMLFLRPRSSCNRHANSFFPCSFKVTRPSYFVGVPFYFEALWYPTFTLIVSLTYSIDNV